LTQSENQTALGALLVSKQGFGCMGLSHSYGQADETSSLETIARAIDLGITFFDTADIYGTGHNEALLGRAIAGKRDRLVIASKFGNRLDREVSGRTLDGSPSYVRSAIDESLRRLAIDRIEESAFTPGSTVGERYPPQMAVNVPPTPKRFLQEQYK